MQRLGRVHSNEVVRVKFLGNLLLHLLCAFVRKIKVQTAFEIRLGRHRRIGSKKSVSFEINKRIKCSDEVSKS